MKAELLVIDVGNTSIQFGHFSGPTLVKSRRIPSRQFIRAVDTVKGHFPYKKIEAAVIASVVPPVGRFLRQELPKKTGIRTFRLGQDLTAPIVNLYKNPKQVGMDRLMNAVAAHQKFGKEAIVIDFGTAITFDVVSKKGAYVGGVIAPGIEISLEALFKRTALLPRIRLLKPKSILGSDTAESIRAGCSYGIGGLCDRVVEEIKRKMRFQPVVIATGGYAKFMSAYCHSLHTVAPNLTLEGIFYSYLRSKKNS